MPDIPDEAVQRAAEDLTAWMLKMDWMTGLSGEQVRIVCRDAATRVLEAAGRDLAGNIGVRILRYADEHEPKPGSPGYLAWHQHFTAAAEVATSAFGEG